MNLAIILAGLTLVLFFVYLIYTNYKRRSYLLFVFFFLPTMDLGVTPAAFGGLTVFDITSYIALIIFYKDFLYLSNKNRGYTYLFFLFVILLVLGSIGSEFVQRSLINIFGVIPPFIFGSLLLKEIRADESIIPQFLKGIKIACCIGIFFIAMQMIVGLKFTFYAVLNQNVMDDGAARYPGFFMDSQISGLFLAMCSYLFLLNYNNPDKPTLSNYFLFGAVIASIILAGARSGLLGFGIGLTFLIIFVGGKFRLNLLLFGALAGVVLFFAADNITLFKRFKNVNESVDFRASIWDGAYDIFKKHPGLGIGIANYQDYVKKHSQDQYLLIDDNEIFFLDQPENGYLKLLAEFGIFAFVILFTIILTPIVNTVYRFFIGKKVGTLFFFIAPMLCCFLSLTSLYTLSDSRIVVLMAACICFLIALNSPKRFLYEG
jgi:O-antigen ligase